MQSHVPGRPTAGVLAGWQVYEGTLHSFFETLFRGIRAAARDADCNLLLACGVSHATGQQVFPPIRPAWPLPSSAADFVPVGPWNTDGLLVIPPLLSTARSRDVQRFMADGHPVVFVGLGEGGPAVIADNEGGIRQALLHLMQHGHRRIAFIAGYEDEAKGACSFTALRTGSQAGPRSGAEGDSLYRRMAYQAAVRDYGLADDPRLIAYGQHNRPGGQRAMQQVLHSGVPFTAVLASNDESAFGALEALKRAGLRVPQDVAVIGFDDRLEAQAQEPPLTTAHYPSFETGYQALLLLLKHIQPSPPSSPPRSGGSRDSPPSPPRSGGSRDSQASPPRSGGSRDSQPTPPSQPSPPRSGGSRDGPPTQPAEAIETVKVPVWLAVRESCGCLPETAFGSPGPLPSPEEPGLDLEQRLVQSVTTAVLSDVQSMARHEVYSLCQRLLSAFIVSLDRGDPIPFCATFQEILHRVKVAGDPVYAWQGAIPALRASVPALLASRPSSETSRRAEKVLHQAQAALNASARQQFAQYVVHAANLDDQVEWMMTRFLVAMDEKQILNTLQEQLPALGLERAEVVFFEPEGDDPLAWATLGIEPPPGTPRRFPTRHFPPAGFYPPGAPFSLALLPLAIEGHDVGFVAFAADSLGVCATIVRQLSAAFRSVRLYREALEGRRLAEEANRMKTRFLSTVSHELRTPLNLISGLSQVLLRGEPAGPAECIVKREDVERIYVSAQHLDSLIQDVLDLARSEVGQLRLVGEPLNVAEVLQAVAVIGEQLARDKGLAWHAEIPGDLPKIWGDRTRLRQVALNLVSNAVKFTTQGQVALEARVAGEVIAVMVSDTGLGIPYAERDLIFDEFRQSERTTARGYGGLGLGLAICKRLVTLHGGDIRVWSTGEEGAGSTFCFTLPVLKEPERKPDQAKAPLAQERVVLLLAAAGNGEEQVREYLAARGFEVEVERTDQAEGWLSHLLASPPAAVVMDSGPASDRGWDVLKVLKGNPATQDVPVLFYSLALERDRGTILEMDYLTKPMGTAELARALARQGLGDGERAGPGRSRRPVLSEVEGKGHPTILVVDDEPGIVEMHARIVQTQLPDCRVLKASNGREALSVIRQERPDLVLLDLMMPELDGFSVLEAMRAGETTQDVPVIVLTGQALTEEDIQRLNQGVTAVLGKGLFSAQETLAHLEAALARQQGLGSETRALVRKAMGYVHEHYADEISPQDVANHVGVSKGYLFRCFRREIGLTPMAYLNRCRIRQAKALLRAGHAVSDVAAAVGFSDSNYFGRVFRRETGQSPTAFRSKKPGF